MTLSLVESPKDILLRNIHEAAVQVGVFSSFEDPVKHCEVTIELFACASAARKAASSLEQLMNTFNDFVEATDDPTTVLAASANAKCQFESAAQHYMNMELQKTNHTNRKFIIAARVALDINQAAADGLEQVNNAVYASLKANPDTAPLREAIEATADEILKFKKAIARAGTNVDIRALTLARLNPELADLAPNKTLGLLAMEKFLPQFQSFGFWAASKQVVAKDEHVIDAPRQNSCSSMTAYGLWAASSVVAAAGVAYTYLSRNNTQA